MHHIIVDGGGGVQGTQVGQAVLDNILTVLIHNLKTAWPTKFQSHNLF